MAIYKENAQHASCFVTTTYSWAKVVETAGIEPASEKEALTASTCVDYG